MSTYQWDILRRQLNAESSYTCFISDRTTLDNYIYYKFNNNDHEKVQRKYYLLSSSNLLHYDIIIFVPIHFEPVDDGYRETSQDYQQLIDQELLSELHKKSEEYSIIYHILKSRYKIDRIKECQEVINGLVQAK